MDKDNDRHWRSARAPRVPVDPGLFLKRLRNALNEPALTFRSSVRPRRVVTYVRTLPDVDPKPMQALLRVEAARRGWEVRKWHELVDACGPQAPQACEQWLKARKLLHEGFADGVLVLDRSHISRNDPEYEVELRFVHERQCFTALVHPESAAA
ncbi:hypothetical protein [Streptomyces sp. WM6378]|uniref:hypothetical protein n=1 Tax=Streptomyces sp. WM6378 TaxID=1415557 RepID=UPI0006AEFF22|nr:hypothetical protein [Streptomyces sp. WM6378]KOU53983.1 hypothetical protein ADK54_02775 [Streptomyces sp. WM6378]